MSVDSSMLAGRKVELPPLAHYRPLHEYSPRYGDYVVWAGWFSTWHGFIVKMDGDNLHVVFAGLPYLLVTLDPGEYEGETKILKLSKMKNSAKGAYAIETIESENRVWYV